MNRRNWLKSAGIIGLFSGVNAFAGSAADSLVREDLNKTYKSLKKDEIPFATSSFTDTRIFPKPLKKGARIAVTAPASPASVGESSAFAKKMKAAGFEVEFGDTVRKRKSEFNYLSASDEARAEELMSFFKRDDIDCIFAARGGYGVMRILDMLDFDIIRKNPKIVIGYSDITALLLAIYKLTSIVCYHGPVASSDFNDFSYDNMAKQIIADKMTNTPLEYKSNEYISITKGSSSGRLIGGNLTMVAATLGTKYEIETKNSIIFLEETREEPYKIDRMLTQLKVAGKFDNCAGVVLGNFEYLKSKRNFYPGRSFSTMQVLKDRLGDLKAPVLFGVPFGHMKNKITLPLGGEAKIDCEKNSFQIIEKSPLI
jgi:muramoyltetrapeptide carboxypeptidase